MKALGLVSRLITGPLWCLHEDKSIHNLDTNKHFLELVNFFDDALGDSEGFMKGKVLPLGEATASWLRRFSATTCLVERGRL